MPASTFSPVKILSAVAASALVLAASASADDVAFKYAASELHSTAGVERLYDRIASRAEAACQTSASDRALYARKASVACQRGLVADWVGGIDDTRLNRIHADASHQEFASVR